MTDQGNPPYPPGPWNAPPPYPGASAPQPPLAPPGSPPRRPQLARHLRRPEPRLGVSLAGVGIGVAVFGVVLWGGDYLVGSGVGSNGPSDSHRLLGIALSLVAIVIGYVLAIGVRTGPLATAGVAASALGVPVLVGFASFSTHTSSGLPFSIDAVVLVYIAAWVLTYAVVPGARGHGFYLGLASTLLWIYVIDKAEPNALSPAHLVQGVLSRGLGISNEGGTDWGTVSVLSFLFGLGYYAVLATLDRMGRHGAAVPFAVSGFLATVVGIAAAAPNVHAKGVGALLIVIGAALAALGAWAVRRFTTWIWAAAVGIGVVVLIADSLRDNTSGAGITLIVCGVGLVVIGYVAARVWGERADDATDA